MASQQAKSVVTVITLMVIMTQIMAVAALYIPNAYPSSRYNSAMRREDTDDEDMDQDASAPYQNQGDNSGPTDHYEDNEPDGPYEETPHEAEGQADLERFFDDHLGASERDGMDKENLPSNLVPLVLANQQVNLRPPTYDGIVANGSEIIATEDDDMDRVYVTNMTNKPFRIDALGGYDPEEDFQDASRDIEESTKFSNSKDKGKNGEPAAKDITFTDPETDTLFNDASETDEVTFALDPDDQSDPDGDRKHGSDDDSEGSWVNDGVEDMEIPSQSHQNSVLEKAAKQQQQADQEEGDNQRMPNADYLKEYLDDTAK